MKDKEVETLARKIFELELGLHNEGISSGILSDDEAYKIIQTHFPAIKEELGFFLDWSEIEGEDK